MEDLGRGRALLNWIHRSTEWLAERVLQPNLQFGKWEVVADEGLGCLRGTGTVSGVGDRRLTIETGEPLAFERGSALPLSEFTSDALEVKAGALEWNRFKAHCTRRVSDELLVELGISLSDGPVVIPLIESLPRVLSSPPATPFVQPHIHICTSSSPRTHAGGLASEGGGYRSAWIARDCRVILDMGTIRYWATDLAVVRGEQRLHDMVTRFHGMIQYYTDLTGGRVVGDLLLAESDEVVSSLMPTESVFQLIGEEFSDDPLQAATVMAYRAALLWWGGGIRFHGERAHFAAAALAFAMTAEWLRWVGYDRVAANSLRTSEKYIWKTWKNVPQVPKLGRLWQNSEARSAMRELVSHLWGYSVACQRFPEQLPR